MCRYAEAAAAAKRMQDLKAAQAERLQGELAGQQRSEICQLQERYQQVGLHVITTYAAGLLQSCM
jgi:hypothetical protein